MQLVLQRDRRLPALVLLVEAGQRVGRVPRTGGLLPEIQIGPGSALAVCDRVEQVAVGHVIPVQVVPRAVGRARQVVRGVAGRDLDDLRILTERRFDRRLSVAEQIVRDAKARVQVLVVRDVLHRR